MPTADDATADDVLAIMRYCQGLHCAAKSCTVRLEGVDETEAWILDVVQPHLAVVEANHEVDAVGQRRDGPRMVRKPDGVLDRAV